MRDAYNAFRLTADGKTVSFGLQEFGKTPVSFDVAVSASQKRRVEVQAFLPKHLA